MNYLNISRSNIFKLLLICFIIFSSFSCSESEAQRDFEEQAFRPPSGIVEMNSNGVRVDGGENDSSDWRTAPDFSGLVRVATPPFPNPVSYNANFEIQLNIIGLDAVKGLSIYAFQQPNRVTVGSALRTVGGTIQPGLKTFTISPQEFAPSSSVGNLGSTWRIIIMDGRQTVITYGDILIE